LFEPTGLSGVGGWRLWGIHPMRGENLRRYYAAAKSKKIGVPIVCGHLNNWGKV